MTAQKKPQIREEIVTLTAATSKKPQAFRFHWYCAEISILISGQNSMRTFNSANAKKKS